MKTMRDTEVRLTPPMLRHALRGWGADDRRDDELIEYFAIAVEIDEHREATANQPVARLNFDIDEIVFACPLPADGLQRRFMSPTVNEWVCFAPGYPAWEAMA